jgi:hypothetical protein
VKVDVQTEAVIDRRRSEVAAFAGDPTNAPSWYTNIDSIEWKTPPPVGIGSRLAFVARFLGRRLEYTYEVTEFRPGELLVMRTSEGSFAMETTYAWSDAGEGKTRMRLRNRGEPRGFAGIAAPVMSAAMRRANLKDLQRLKQMLEQMG